MPSMPKLRALVLSSSLGIGETKSHHILKLRSILVSLLHLERLSLRRCHAYIPVSTFIINIKLSFHNLPEEIG